MHHYLFTPRNESKPEHESSLPNVPEHCQQILPAGSCASRHVTCNTISYRQTEFGKVLNLPALHSSKKDMCNMLENVLIQ